MHKFMSGDGITKEEYEILNNILPDLDPNYGSNNKVHLILLFLLSAHF